MVEQVKQILSKPVEEVINSPLSLVLLKCYSVLYLNGGQPRACAVSQRGYYAQIARDGLQKAEIMENKTCKLVDGRHWVKPLADHLTNSNITDEVALKCLGEGWLLERHFITLPEGYKTKKHPDIIDSKAETAEIPKAEKPKRNRVS